MSYHYKNDLKMRVNEKKGHLSDLRQIAFSITTII